MNVVSLKLMYNIVKIFGSGILLNNIFKGILKLMLLF